MTRHSGAGLACDVGCAFNLQYREGGGLLHVTSGWVDFDGLDRSSLVPAGAVAELREHLGPGSPYYLDAPREFARTTRAIATRSRACSPPRVRATR